MTVSAKEKLAQARTRANKGGNKVDNPTTGGTATETPTPPAAVGMTGAPTATMKRPTVENDRDSLWYLDETNEELQGVTWGSSNLAIGITNLSRYVATSDAQTNASIFCKVTAQTTIGTINNITVFFKELEDGRYALRVAAPRNKQVARDNPDNVRWTSDLTLSAPVRAQIARWLHYQIKENRDWAERMNVEIPA